MWWLGLTAELDPESSECFIAESPRLGNWGKDLAIFEDCFGADSDVVCSIGVSNVLVRSLENEKLALVCEECATIYQNTESRAKRQKMIRKMDIGLGKYKHIESTSMVEQMKTEKSTSTCVELHIFKSKPFGVCSASVLTRHGPSQEICWLKHSEHTPSERWGTFVRHYRQRMFKFGFNKPQCILGGENAREGLYRARISFT